MNKAESQGIPIVYVSLGSLCQWQKWSVDAIYNGLKKLGVKVIWSLKDAALLPTQNDPDFFVRPWQPQA